VPFKANQDRRHHIPKQQHRVTNWAEYDAALRRRGSLTVWFTDAAIAAWGAERRTTPGGQPRYSSLAITTVLTLRAVFRLALRQTEGLIRSIVRLLGLPLAVPDHSTLSRRAETLRVVRPRSSSVPVHLIVDSTGLRLCGPGEWLVEKHGPRTRRSWRKLHLGVDADTGEIVAAELTSRDADDGSQVGPLLDQVERPVASFTGDGARSTETMCTARWRRVILARQSSCRRVRAQCRAARPRPRRRSATTICGSSPSAVAWAGKRRPGTTTARWLRPTSVGTNA
jgi:IS5 family transposase